LDQLREKGLASSQSFKLNKSETSSFLTPEEAQAFLNTSARDRRASIQNNISNAPSNLSTVGMNAWYNDQKMRYLEEKKKREEAEQFLRGYRQSYTAEESSVESGTTATTTSTYDTNTKDFAEVGVLDKRMYKETLPQCTSDSKDNFAKVMAVQQTVGPTSKNHTDVDEMPIMEHTGKQGVVEMKPTIDGPSNQDTEGYPVATNAIGVVEKVEKSDVEPIEQQPSGDGAVDKTAELDCTIAESHQEDGHGMVEKIDTGLVDQQLDIDCNSTKPASIMDSNTEINDPIDPQNCTDEEGDNASNVNITVKSQVKSQNLAEEEDGKEQIHITPNEDGQDEVTEQVQTDHVQQDSANVPCNTDVEHCSRNELNAVFQAEASRYHLYISHACPFAHRTAIVVALKGLQEIIGVTHVHPTWQYTKPGTDEHRGWVFGSPDGKPLSNTNGYGSFPSSWGQEDPHTQSRSIRELYEKDNDTRRQYTVPVLWDTKLKTIVSNNSSDIMRIINSEFNEFAKNPDLDLYPKDTREVIDTVNSWVYSSLNDGVYNCGLAESQGAYEAAIDDVTDAFDKVELILKEQRYITGGKITEADVRLFVTLLQFDEIYSVYFKANTRSVSLCPIILKYVRRIYQLDGVKETCDMDMVKAHYYTSHVELNKFSIIPRGEDFMELLQSSRSSR